MCFALLADVPDVLTPEPGAFYQLDRGQMDCARLHALHEAGSFLLIRAKRGLRSMRRYSLKCPGFCGGPFD